MVDFSSIGSFKTPLSPQDRLLPVSITEDGKAIIKQIAKGKNPSDGESTSIAIALSAVVASTKGNEVDQLWGRIEKAFGDGDSFSIDNNTSFGQIENTLGLFYNLLNAIDEGSNTNLMAQFRAVFLETQKHVEDRLIPQLESTEQNKIKRIIRISTKRISQVIKRMNLDVSKGKIPGPEIPTS